MTYHGQVGDGGLELPFDVVAQMIQASDIVGVVVRRGLLVSAYKD